MCIVINLIIHVSPKAEKLKTGNFNKLVLLVALWQAGEVQALNDEFERLSAFWPIMQPVEQLVQQISQSGVNAIFDAGYVSRRFQQ